MNLRRHLMGPILAAAVAGAFLAVGAMAAAPATGAGGAAATVDQNGPTILQTYKGQFLIGTSVDVPGGFSDAELSLIKQNFDCITPENYMKPEPIHPLENVWSFTRPDALVKWCSENGISVHGHTLVWHSQTGNWFFEGGDRDTVIQRLKNHITTLVGRYKGKVRDWDVVNEAINDGAGGGGMAGENLRQDQWLRIIGPEYLTIAFKTAHEADPDAKLFYNDYNIESGTKHQNSMALLKRLISEGAPIYGVGIQGHWSTGGVPYAAVDKAISDYASLGLKVAISELDVTINGASGGQLGPGGGGGGRRGRGGGAPGAAPGGGAFLMEDGPYVLTAAPGGGGFGRGGGGGFGGRGGGFGGGGRGAAQAAPVNPATTIESAVTDLSDEQKARIADVSKDVAAKLADWQSSSQVALLQVQPQYSPGQVAYTYELQEFSAEQTRQNNLRDQIIDDGEARLVVILAADQAEKWETARLNTLVSTQFGTLGITDAEKTKMDGIVADATRKLMAAHDQTAVADAKAEFTKNVLAVLDDAQVSQYKALIAGGNGGGRGGAPGGRGRGGPATAAGLKSQANAYARLFAIFEKHKETMDRVTIWGLNDARSWRPGQHAVVLDENDQRKAAYVAIVNALLHPDPDLAAPQ